MATAFEMEPQQNFLSRSESESEWNSCLLSFQNEMTALRLECDKLKTQEQDLLFDSDPDHLQPVLSAANGIVVKINHLFSIFLRDFYYPLKWSRLHREKELRKILEYVQFWYGEFEQHVNYFVNFLHPLEAHETLKALGKSLLYNSMVMKVQPPRVIKRGQSVDTAVGILCDTKKPNKNGNGNQKPHGQPFLVRIFVLHHKEAVTLFKDWEAGKLNPKPNATSKPIAPSVLLNLDESRNILLQSKQGRKRKIFEEPEPFLIKTEFRGLTVDSPEKGGEMRKFCLLYLKTVEIDGVAMETWCFSLPFVLIASVNQKCPANAIIFWDNYFTKKENWLPFQVEEETSWKDLSLALIDYFKSETKTEWDLTPANLKHIGKKIFETDDFHDNSVVKGKEFCHTLYGNAVKEKEMTTWRWLFSIGQLIKKRLRKSWDLGAIVGFIDRFEAENLIRSQDRGTFLIRFSDKFPGGVTYTVAITPTPDDLRNGFKSGAQSCWLLCEGAENGEQDERFKNLEQVITTSYGLTNVLYFEPSLDYREVLKPKGEKFTPPPPPTPYLDVTPYAPPIFEFQELIRIAYEKSLALCTGEFSSVYHGRCGSNKVEAEQNKMAPSSGPLRTPKQTPDVKVTTENLKPFRDDIKILSFQNWGNDEILKPILASSHIIKICRPLTALELCKLNDIKNFRSSGFEGAWIWSHSFMPQLDKAETQDLALLSFSLGIANGMSYLTEKKVILGDFTAQNVLLTQNRQVKICDFEPQAPYKSYEKSVDTSFNSLVISTEASANTKLSLSFNPCFYEILLRDIFSLGENSRPGFDGLELETKPKLTYSRRHGYRVKMPVFSKNDMRVKFQLQLPKCCDAAMLKLLK